MIDWTLGIQGLVLGLGSVFTILFLLIIFISLMGVLVQNSEKKKSAKSEPKIAAKAVSSQDSDEEIIAAISAAIACMAQREGKKFKIRSFKRV